MESYLTPGSGDDKIPDSISPGLPTRRLSMTARETACTEHVTQLQRGRAGCPDERVCPV
jgi:hypothetical protein